jgi:large subunit ribosomal protein L30
MAKVKITQVRSSIKRPANQKATLTALGLRGINKSVELELTDTIKGKINVVKHLISVEEI